MAEEPCPLAEAMAGWLAAELARSGPVTAAARASVDQAAAALASQVARGRERPGGGDD